MGKTTDDAVVTFGAWIVTGILVLVIGGGLAIGVSMVAGIGGGMVAFFIITIIIVIIMTKRLKNYYRQEK